METFDAIYGRRAMRDYTPQCMERDTLDRLIDAIQAVPVARKAPRVQWVPASPL